jgi:hypothetical protein
LTRNLRESLSKSKELRGIRVWTRKKGSFGLRFRRFENVLF